jgi:Ca2+-binding RTX toxin-like protein
MKRRAALLVSMVVGVLLVATTAGAAWAKTVTCEPGSTKEDPCEGTPRADLITGTAGSDYIVAKGGDDRVVGKAGADTIIGGLGDDRLFGRAGDDLLLDRQGPNTGDRPDADATFDGPGSDLADVFDGDSLDVACFGGTVGDGATGDGRDRFNPRSCP